MPLQPDGTFQGLSSSKLRDADDIRMVASVINGNVEAFSTLVIRYQDRVYPTVYAMVRNKDEADQAWLEG